MLTEGSPVQKREGEEFLGLTTVDCARLVISELPTVKTLNFRSYCYIPQQLNEGSQIFSLSREEFLHGADLSKKADNLSVGWDIALSSRVDTTDSSSAHFALIDLAVKKTDTAIAKVTKQFEKYGITSMVGGGFLLETGKSYHFFGQNLLPFQDWLDFLGRCLLTSIVTTDPVTQENIHERIVDERFIGHSLRRGSCDLRVTSNSKNVIPRVVKMI